MARFHRRQIPQRDKILIVTNGKTESNYFMSLKKHTLYSLDIKCIEHTSCDKLVETAILQRDIACNQVWCVFDIDQEYQDGHLRPAIENASKNDIRIAWSNQAFEVWLLFHFINVIPQKDRSHYESMINNELLKLRVKYTYSKTAMDIFKETYKRTKIAITNAKISFQRKEVECKNLDEKPFWEWLSTTTIYKLIEDLNLF